MTAEDRACAVQLLRAAAADHLTHLDPAERDELVERISAAIDRCARRRAAEELRDFADDMEASALAHRAAVMRHHQTARPSNQLRARELRAGHAISAMLSIATQARCRAEEVEGLAVPRPPIDRTLRECGPAKSSARAEGLAHHEEAK